ncbi:hypothetical protein A3H90_03050 [Candidatus Peribacteria bacterium RIFCSPLOWO2_02_FULL_55_36]|nr:MAG: hypothetical protein A2789_04355 [Candidatus Peribacteria bacterium RIFCSPHIGHO2_01_FULL_54_22]OGJ62882.1 MAG: hypothetical protein A3D12_01040 [Candidatus Peribacteria bacterium RIFCSPHIGHO2_02_FULL_55_24]OGJ69377.1 MAG: hypothetical protein A3H90_03050 [Candidatus Peribacteria bacterium RIFCSPLOWO2_02_FULL_55_36]
MNYVNGFLWIIALVTEVVMFPLGIVAWWSLLWINTFGTAELHDRLFASPHHMTALYAAMGAWFLSVGVVHYIRRSFEGSTG